MFTTEIRINGTLILHIYGINTAVQKEGKTQYKIDIYNTEKLEAKSFNVYHYRRDGISKLIELILAEYNSAI